MNRLLRHAVTVLASILIGIGVCAPATAAYPDHPIKLIISYPAGTATDTLARTIGAKLQQALGQPVIIEIKTGGGGNNGLAAAARAAPDGYTLTIGGSAMCINQTLYGGRDVDPERDFTPVATIASTPVIIVASPSSGIRSLADLISRARSDPGSLAYSTPGVGTPTHVAAELLAQRAGIRLLHVPYAGSGPLMTDVLSGAVPLSFTLPGAVQSLIAAGKLVPVAVTGPGRLATLPDVPTVAESGFPGFDVLTWHSILAPAHTPPAIVDLLSREFTRIVMLPDVRERFLSIGLTPDPGGADLLSAKIADEVARWREVIVKAGLHVD